MILLGGWPLYGVLLNSSFGWGWSAAGAAGLALALGHLGVRAWMWALALLACLYGFGAPVWLLAAGMAAGILIVFVPIRRHVLTRPMMAAVRSADMLPRISDTEQVAIEAGTVWVDGELFSGKPNFRRILRQPYPSLTHEEQVFLDGPVEELCRVTDSWRLWGDRELPPEAWEIIRREKFFGLIIPKEYGGHGFSARANSAVVQKLHSRCGPLATMVMVPNSLGPAELLVHYGTKEQQDYYLPRLADASLIPAFALTEAAAGSDAGAVQAKGVVFQDQGGDLKLRLTWDKRYITLAPMAGVLGLAFKLYDPENLLSRGRAPGITCALIPTTTPGVVTGQRHDPLGVPFPNGPTEGRDVVVPVDAIIGGAAGAGHGWRMLVESLATGRGISLPAVATGGIKTAYLVASAYAMVREQFGLPIGRFEGIQEALSRIGGAAYLSEAAAVYTVGAIDRGAKPAVVTAMAKYSLTELSRKVVLDAMDILGGNGISGGPRNLLCEAYVSVPISITVEGANILTRTLIVFGQGAIRCHPWAYKVIGALRSGDHKDFDEAIWGFMGHVLRNKARTFVLGITRGRLQLVPARGLVGRYLRKLGWASASFAFLADGAIMMIGASLKRKERVAGRFADILSWMYLAAAALRRFEAEGRLREDEPYLRWVMDFAFSKMQTSFEDLLANMPIRGLAWIFRGPLLLWWRINPLSLGPKDSDGRKIAQLMQTAGEQRSRMAQGVYVPEDADQAMGRLQQAFIAAANASPARTRVHRAVRSGTVDEGPAMVDDAVAAGVITEEEKDLIIAAAAAQWDAIQVDSFEEDEYLKHYRA